MAEATTDPLHALRDGLARVLREQHDALRQVVDGLDREGLNWRPGPETNSVAVLVTHALGAQEFLLATAVGQEVARDRDAEFRVEAADVAELLRWVDAAAGRIARLVERLTLDDLGAVRQPANDRLNRRFPGTWWLLHAVEHTREHLGQAQLTRQLYEQQRAAR